MNTKQTDEIATELIVEIVDKIVGIKGKETSALLSGRSYLPLKRPMTITEIWDWALQARLRWKIQSRPVVSLSKGVARVTF